MSAAASSLMGNVVGPQGPAGATGATGPAGDDGAVGATGLGGATGPQGIQGVPEKNGESVIPARRTCRDNVVD